MKNKAYLIDHFRNDVKRFFKTRCEIENENTDVPVALAFSHNYRSTDLVWKIGSVCLIKLEQLRS